MKLARLISLLFPFLLTSCIKNVNTYNYMDSNKYKMYEEKVFIDNVTTLDLAWINGEIEIKESADNQATIYEENKTGEYLPCYYFFESNGTLNVKPCKNDTPYVDINNSSKKLVIELPSTVQDISLDNVSASIDMNLGDLNSLKINTVSALLTIKLGNVNKLDINNVSGNASIKTNSLSTFDFDTVSGNIYLTVYEDDSLSSIKIDSVSANAVLYLEGNRGYDLDFDTITGSKNLQFIDGDDPTLEKYSINYKSVSGSLNINKIAN